jgi:HPt (histidine-containing phosphotransfer) domain-containing protein
MAANAQDLDEKLQAIFQSFHAKVVRHLADMAGALGRAGAPGDDTARKAALQALEGQAHKMAGTAGTFGLDGLTGPARALEEACRRINEQGRPPLSEEHNALGQALELLRQAYAHEKVPTP